MLYCRAALSQRFTVLQSVRSINWLGSVIRVRPACLSASHLSLAPLFPPFPTETWNAPMSVRLRCPGPIRCPPLVRLQLQFDLLAASKPSADLWEGSVSSTGTAGEAPQRFQVGPSGGGPRQLPLQSASPQSRAAPVDTLEVRGRGYKNTCSPVWELRSCQHGCLREVGELRVGLLQTARPAAFRRLHHNTLNSIAFRSLMKPRTVPPGGRREICCWKIKRWVRLDSLFLTQGSVQKKRQRRKKKTCESMVGNSSAKTKKTKMKVLSKTFGCRGAAENETATAKHLFYQRLQLSVAACNPLICLSSEFQCQENV